MSDDLMNQDQSMLDAAQNLGDEQAILAQQAAMEQPAGKTFSQDDLDRIVKREKSEAYERAKRELESQMRKQGAGSVNQAEVAAQNGLTQDEVMRMIQEQAARMQQEQAAQMMAQQTVKEFVSKMEQGKDKYEDFEDTVKQIGLQNYPQIVRLANSVPNTADVVYELANNPMKLDWLKDKADEDEALAIREMQKLSNSIMYNEKQQNRAVRIKEPLSQIKPSAGVVDKGPVSVSDFRRQPWLKR